MLPIGQMPLDMVVREKLLEERRNTLHQYFFYLQYSLEAIQKIGWVGGKAVQTKCMKVGPDNRVRIPQDAEIITKVGVRRGDRLLALHVDNSLAAPLQGKPLPAYAPNQKTTFYNYYGDYTTGHVNAYLLGSTSEFSGYFRVENHHWLLVAAGMEEHDLYLEYISQEPSRENGRLMVPSVYGPLIKEYISLKSQPRQSYAVFKQAEDIWTRSLHVLQSDLQGVSLESLGHLLRQHTHNNLRL